MQFKSVASEEQLVKWRRQLHNHAETGLSEFWTTAFLADILTRAGISVTIGKEIMAESSVIGRAGKQKQEKRMERALKQGANPEWLAKMAGCTGLVADLRPDLASHTAFRFDIDAVDIQESMDIGHNPADLGFASINPGCSHACGHDGHAAIGLGVALTLAAQKEKLRHNVRLIFEPGEEGSRGARPLIDAGVVDNIRYFMTAHIGLAATRAHSLFCGTKGFLATTKFDAEFFGNAAHAGGDPHLGRNSLLAGACAALNMHALPRHGAGDTRITVGKMDAGTGRNIIPDHARLECETRGENTELDEFMFEAAKRIIKNAAGMYEQEYEVTITGQTPSAQCDEEMIRIVRKAAEQIPYYKKGGIADLATLHVSDDACAFMRKVQSQGGLATYALIGSQLAAGHHQPRFDFDESMLYPTMELFCRCAWLLDEMG